MKKIIVLVWCLQSVVLLGQNIDLEWAGTFGGTDIQEPNGIAVDQVGNVFTVGEFEGTADFDPGTGVFNLSTVNAASSTELFLTKLDANGNLVWAKQIGCYGYGTARGTAITVDPAGNLYIAGYFNRTADFDPGPGVHDVSPSGTTAFILKLDNNGSFNWVKLIEGSGNKYISRIKLDADNNIHIVGEYSGIVDFDPGAGTFQPTSNGALDVYVAKYDNDGNFMWVKSLGAGSNDNGNDVAIDPQGNVFVVGYFLGTVDFDPGAGIHNLTTAAACGFILKLDLNGNFVWVRQLTHPAATGNQTYAIGIATDAQGNSYVSGYFYGTIQLDAGTSFTVFGSSSSHDAFVGKWNAAGDLLWGKQIGGTNRIVNQGIALDNSGNVYTSGHFHGTIDFDPGNATYNVTSAGGFDVGLSKLDGNGNFIAAGHIGGTETDYCQGLAVDASGMVYLAGYFFGTADFDPGAGTHNSTSVGTTLATADAFTAKYSFSSCTVTGTDVRTACGSYTWIDGNTYYASNNTATHTIAGGAANGCDSIVTLNLTIKQPTTSAVSATACGSYSWHGTTYTASGTHTWVGTNEAGCDSTVTLNLTINQPTTSAVSATACGTYSWHGTTYTTSGAYTWGGTNAAGCDSTVTLNLTINQPTTSAVSATACGSYSWHGTTYTASGTHTWVGTNAAGCDSTVTLNLTINQPTSSAVSASACGQYTWSLNGQTYTTSGAYTHVVQNANGCDSTITLNLTINQPTSSAVSASACGQYTWPLNGQTYTTSGAYPHVIQNANGCDSTITLNLTINQPTSSAVSASACGQYTWSLNGQTYTSSGAYPHVIQNANGCDSTITLNLTINTIDATVAVSGITLTANQSDAIYQWVDCDNGNAPIAGATAQSFTPSANGNYAVQVTANGCTETSSCAAITSVGIASLETVSWTVYPNPTNGLFTIISSQDGSDAAIEIYSSTGQLIYKTYLVGSEAAIDLGGHPNGMYLVRINNYLNYRILLTE